jgi:hypothetical protein
MDRVKIYFGFFSLYSLLSLTMSYIITPPASLSKKQKYDFLGQHVSFIHSVFAILISLYVYILEGGIFYEAPTNSYHIIVMSVIAK